MIVSGRRGAAISSPFAAATNQSEREDEVNISEN